MNVTYLNYSSIYGHILLEDDFLNNKPFTFDDFLKRFTFNPRSQVCFSNVPHGAGSSRPFKIAMEIKIKKKEDYGEDCENQIFIFTKKEVNEWMREISKVKKFKYKIKHTEKDLSIYLYGEFKRSELLFVLTSIRYLYEFPQVHLLKESFLLRKNNLVNGLSLLDTLRFKHLLFRTCRALSGHSLIDAGEYIPTKKISLKTLSKDLSERNRVQYCFSKDTLITSEFDFKETGFTKKDLGEINSITRKKVENSYKKVIKRKDLNKIYHKKEFEKRLDTYYPLLESLLNHIKE